MPDSSPNAIKRFIFWDYARASVPYDVMVALILVFIFATPREWFRDQPKAASVVMVPSSTNASVFWIEPDLLAGVPEADRADKAAALLHKRTGKKHTVSRVEPILDEADAEQEVKGYIAYSTP